jgi:hypothetical protein
MCTGGGGKFQDRNFKQGQEFLALIQVFKDRILNPCEFGKSASRYDLFFWSDEPVKLDTDFVASPDKAKGNLWCWRYNPEL